jgi:hypothetical protein
MVDVFEDVLHVGIGKLFKVRGCVAAIVREKVQIKSWSV